MKESERKEDIFEQARAQHESLDRRLTMLLKKPYLSPDEEVEIRDLKKQKLYYKDMMEKAREELGKKEGN